jgi:osmoprotectant transport system substrate-binding protein
VGREFSAAARKELHFMHPTTRATIIFAVALLVASACGGASSGAKPTVIIGSTNFSEQLVLGELYAQTLEANGYTVTRKFNLGTREIVFPALEKGDIDMEADYLATLLGFVDKTAQGSTDPKATAATLAKALEPKKLTVLDYAPAVDQNGFVVTKATADKYKLTKLSDVAPVASQLVLGAPPECPSTVAALSGGQIDVGLLFTTDATIAVKGFVLLDDDKHLQLSDNVAPVVRNDLLTKGGDAFKTLINSIAPKLTTAELTAMNKLVEVDKQDPKVVAKDWLKKQGIVK